MNIEWIVTGDWHLRADRPLCRNDEDWMATQAEMIRWVLKQAKDNDADVIHTGDLFHRSWPGIDVLNMVIQIFLEFPEVSIYGIAGNHEMPYHNVNNLNRSAWGVLFNTGLIKPVQKAGMSGGHFGEELTPDPGTTWATVLHQLVIPRENGILEQAGAVTADTVLMELNKAGVVLTGDYHHHFTFEDDAGRILINPGCLNRQASDMVEYQPVVYCLSTEMEVEFSIVPDPDAFDLAYKTEAAVKEDRMAEFVRSLTDVKAVNISFSDRVREHLSQNQIRPGVRNVVLEALGTEIVT